MVFRDQSPQFQPHLPAINQFRIDTPGCVKQCIIPDVVLFVNGIPNGCANTAPVSNCEEIVARFTVLGTVLLTYSSCAQLLRRAALNADLALRISAGCSTPSLGVCPYGACGGTRNHSSL